MEGATAKTVFLFGRPGSGKGTQAKLLAEKLGWSVFSTGERFKELRDSSGALGERVRAAYDAGQLIPDWFPSYLYEDALLTLPADGGVVCEGFPRTLAQAKRADDVLAFLARPYLVLHLFVSEEESLKRMLLRAGEEDRPDSNDEAKIRARFATYTKQTEPVLDFFRAKGALTEVNGEQTREAILRDILASLRIA